jgi:hypothetical protein
MKFSCKVRITGVPAKRLTGHDLEYMSETPLLDVAYPIILLAN